MHAGQHKHLVSDAAAVCLFFLCRKLALVLLRPFMAGCLLLKLITPKLGVVEHAWSLLTYFHVLIAVSERQAGEIQAIPSQGMICLLGLGGWALSAQRLFKHILGGGCRNWSFCGSHDRPSHCSVQFCCGRAPPAVQCCSSHHHRSPTPLWLLITLTKCRPQSPSSPRACLCS